MIGRLSKFCYRRNTIESVIGDEIFQLIPIFLAKSSFREPIKDATIILSLVKYVMGPLIT